MNSDLSRGKSLIRRLRCQSQSSLIGLLNEAANEIERLQTCLNTAKETHDRLILGAFNEVD